MRCSKPAWPSAPPRCRAPTKACVARTSSAPSAQRAALEARREAERANLSKTRFLAAASHDLLQPLNAARLFAACAHKAARPRQQQALDQIQSSLEAAQALLEPLLDISKIDAGAWDVNEQAFPLTQHPRSADRASSTCWPRKPA